MADPRAVLTSGDWLQAHLDEPSVRVIEIQYEPDIDEYREGHIPGAVNWYWKDMLWHDTERQFPTPRVLAERFGAWGISPEATVVFYSGRNQYAMFAYWVAAVMNGHPDVRVLDGCQKRWQLDGRPLTKGVPQFAPVSYEPQHLSRDDSTRVSRGELRADLGKPGMVVLDARYESEFLGERVKPGTGFDYGAERHGRIPGAVHLMFRRLFNDDNTLKSSEELEEVFRSVGAAPDQADEVVAYCRLSHRASSLWFCATQVLGWDHLRVYDGSWTEVGLGSRIPHRTMTRSERPEPSYWR